MKFVDRILTIVITATVTSMVWIVAGGSLIEMADSTSQRDSTRPAEAAPSPEPTGTASPEPSASPTAALPGAAATKAAPLDEGGASDISQSDAQGLMIPVLNVRPADLSDTFTDEGPGGGRLHEAIDIMAPKGTSVVAAAPGKIEKLFSSSAGGNTIYVRSPDGETLHYYAHLSEYAPGLKEGQRIRRGQRLGTVGTTGNARSEAPHLHFAILRTTADAEWWEPANAVNPYPLLARE